MKASCRIIEDLLPLYHDNVCSLESKALVEEHLPNCAACSKLLSQMKEDSPPLVANIEDATAIKSIQKVWHAGRKRALIKGFVIAFFVCAVLLGGYYGLTRWKCIPVASELLNVSNVSQLADGRIIYHLNVRDNKNLYFIKFTLTKDCAYYMTPMRSIIESKRSSALGLFNEYFLVDVAENNAHQKSYGDGIVITSVYLGSPDDSILIWNADMELPTASDALEALVN